jgi:formate dehydrogenase major subunit
MDACRSAVRAGAEEVYTFYRRTREEMPADKVEVNEAEEEGVIFKFLCNPVEILSKDGVVCGIKAQKMELGEPDASGRRSPVPVEGAFEIVELDTVIMAIGVNKIVKDKNEAMARIKSIACVKNARRLNRATPCAENGKCESCLIPGNTICCNTVYTRFSVIPNRIKVIIINESLGF